MDKQNSVVSIGKYLHKERIYIFAKDSLIGFSPKNTRIIFDNEYLELKTYQQDVTLKYINIQSIDYSDD